MGYRISLKQPLARQLSGIVREELDTALESLAGDEPDAGAIHEARKCVKRLRAVLRLVEAELGPEGEKFTTQLRTAAHALAAMREADANLETLALLQKSYPSVITGAAAAAARRGLEGREHASRTNAGEALQLARGALEQVKLSAPERVNRVARFRVVREGAVQAYRRTRRVLRRLSIDASDAAFHLWRRRLKDHYYHMLLFERIHSAPRARARALNRLEECLGDDHNLALLSDLILASPRRYGTAQHTALLLGFIATEQRRLRLLALAQGKEAFGWRPAEFAEALEGWWNAG